LDKWGVEFIKALINISHKQWQWIFRNSDVHHVIDRLTSCQHTALFSRVHELMQTPSHPSFRVTGTFWIKTSTASGIWIHTHASYGYRPWNPLLALHHMLHQAITLLAVSSISTRQS
jgi:hypothetical protein